MCRFAFELQRRRVCRTVLSYSLLVWLNVQIGDVFFPMAGLPEWSLRLVVVIGFLGLPLVIFLAWTFQITPHGVRVDSSLPPLSTSENGGPHGRGAEMMVNVALLVLGAAIAGWLVTEHAMAELRRSEGARSGNLEGLPRPQALAVALSFQSTGDRKVSAGFVQGLEAQIRHQLIQLPNVTVIRYVEAAATDGAGELLVSGFLRFEKGQVHVLVDALDLASNKYLWTARFDLKDESMPEAERAAADRIVAEIRRALPAEAQPNPRDPQHSQSPGVTTSV